MYLGKIFDALMEDVYEQTLELTAQWIHLEKSFSAETSAEHPSSLFQGAHKRVCGKSTTSNIGSALARRCHYR